LRDRIEILKRASVLAAPEGLILEFGVATGGTIRVLANELSPRKVYGFDSFKGLAEPWGNYPAGEFACTPPTVPDNVELIVGLFAQTLPQFLATHHGDAALIHIDCDLYASTMTVLEALTPRIIPGTVIVMDEFWIVTEHEQAAFDHWITLREVKYRDDSRAAEQHCVVIE
jgi:predicted O-methyltransferase YrrM